MISLLDYSRSIIYGVLIYLPSVWGRLDPPGLLNECYENVGDVRFGLSVAIRQTDGDIICGDQFDIAEIQVVEAFDWSLTQINQDPSILPNISIGFAVLDNCGEVVTALSRNVFFLPDDEAIPATLQYGNCSQQIPNFQVVSVVSPYRSIQTVLVAPLFSIFDIPLIGTTSTSDDLSDKSRYEYFIRVAPPDRFQTNAMLDLLTHMNWTYFSVIFSEGNYGENGAKYLEKGAEGRGLCIAYSQMIYAESEPKDYDGIINKLIQNREARAVILFMENSDLATFFEQLAQRNVFNRFIWIGSDTFGFEEYGPAANGGIAFHFSSGDYPPFDDHYFSLNPVYDDVSPWYRLNWEKYFNCSWSDTGWGDCAETANETLRGRELIGQGRVYKLIDATYTLALGLDSLVRSRCPGAFSDVTLLEDCVIGEEYLEHLKQVNFTGITGDIVFDDNGDVIAKYVLRQYLSDQEGIGEEIGFWSQATGELSLDMEAVNWSVFVSSRKYGEFDEVVKSVCSEPCLAKQYYIQKEQICCWECDYCRSNEIVVDNGTRCEECPENYWPDEVEALTCEPIVPDYLEWSSSLGVALAAINTIGLVLAILMSMLFIRHRHEKLIKASSRELIALIMTGISLAHVTVYLILSKPRDAICPLQTAGFDISVTIIYAPLLVKNNRVYRIFKAGGKGIQHPRLISTRAQVVFTCILILIQVLVCTVTGIFLPSQLGQSMPVSTEKKVEMYCDTPLARIIIGISYNLTLLIACAVFGFMTRKLPENFNESWYIFVSVSTTMFMWLVFLPTYFTTFYAESQVVLLATCLFLNAIITLLCLFAPKVYAIFYVEDENMKFATMTTNTAVAPSGVQPNKSS